MPLLLERGYRPTLGPFDDTGTSAGGLPQLPGIPGEGLRELTGWGRKRIGSDGSAVLVDRGEEEGQDGGGEVLHLQRSGQRKGRGGPQGGPGRWHVEKWFERAKQLAGFGDFEVRKYVSLMRHWLCSRIVMYFLAAETTRLRGEKSADYIRAGDRRGEAAAGEDCELLAKNVA